MSAGVLRADQRDDFMSGTDFSTGNPMGEALLLHLEALHFAGLEWLPRPQLAATTSSATGNPPSEAVVAAAPNHLDRTRSASSWPRDVRSLSETSGRPSPTKSNLTPSSVSDSPMAVTSLFDQPLERSARSPQEKAQALDELNRLHVIGCSQCPELVRNRTQTVFGVGNPDAELVLVGEAPGQEEDVQGEPFVGAAGQLLNRILAACGLRREDVYICNVLKCRPPNNRTPLPQEIANCRGYLEQQLAIIAPKYICCLGAIAAQTLLQTNQSISKLRGKVHRYRGAALVCTYHPAYLLRNPHAKREVWEDMKLLLRTMGRPIPRRPS